MKSWLSIFLPDDEYKRERVIYFLAEGGVLLLLYFVGALLISRLIPSQNLTGQLVVLIGFGLYATYTTLRYSLSGIEFADVIEPNHFKKQQRKLFKQSIGFFVIFLMISLLSHFDNLLPTIVIALVASMLLYVLNYTSLKRSYTKNKELID
ncbi:hypothetical protein NSQ54_04280 [Alkalihalobacillus sp. FSL W8-0930]